MKRGLKLLVSDKARARAGDGAAANDPDACEVVRFAVCGLLAAGEETEASEAGNE